MSSRYQCCLNSQDSFTFAHIHIRPLQCSSFFLPGLDIRLGSFASGLKYLFYCFHSTGLLVPNPHSFCLSENAFILPSLVRILHLHTESQVGRLPLSALNIPVFWLPKFLLKSQTLVLLLLLLKRRELLMCSLSLAVFRIVLVFSNLTMIFLGLVSLFLFHYRIC